MECQKRALFGLLAFMCTVRMSFRPVGPFSASWPSCVQSACLFAPLSVGFSGGGRAAPGLVAVVVGSSSVLRALCGAALLSVGVRVWARVFCWSGSVAALPFRFAGSWNVDSIALGAEKKKVS